MSNQLREEFLSLVSGTRGLLEDMGDLGVEDLLFPAAAEVPSAAATLGKDPGAGKGFSLRENSAAALDAICRELDGCQRCPLGAGCNHLVFGGGNPEAKLVFVGEAPGREEDRRGVPFVGEAGQLLDRILFAMGLEREDVYICNVIKCRPSGNRDPKPAEIEACEPYLKRQLAAIQPRVLVALGKFAAQTLLRERTPISRLRGHWREYQGIPLMPTYHPAYLLRNPASKKEAWTDMKQVMQKLW
jgi:DNA polymerase